MEHRSGSIETTGQLDITSSTDLTPKTSTVYLRIIPFRKLEKSSCHYRQPDIIVLYDHVTLEMLQPSNILTRIISL